MGLGKADGHSADVMVTVDAMKTTNKELRKQYGKVNIDKSELFAPLLLFSFFPFQHPVLTNATVEQMQDEMADLMDIGNDIQESISRSYDVPDGNRRPARYKSNTKYGCRGRRRRIGCRA